MCFSSQYSYLKKLQMLLMGHIKVLGGPYVARGQDVAQAWSKEASKNSKPTKSKSQIWKK